VRYLGAKAKEGQKEVKSFIAKATKASHAEVGAHKLSPKERVAHKVTESKDLKHDRTYKFNEHGNSAEVKARNGSTLKLEYKDSKQPGKLTGYSVVDKHGTYVVGAESSKDVSIKFDDKTGTVIEQRIKADKAGAEPVTVETQATPEGTFSVIERDSSGRRREKRYFDSSRTERARTVYKYERASKGGEGKAKESVVATQFDERGELRHQHLFDSHDHLERQKASSRLDRTYKNEKGVHSELIERYDLKKDAYHPISRSQVESDYNVGKTKIRHEQLEGGKPTAVQTSVHDEMGRLQEFELQSKAEASNFKVKFDRNGRPDKVTGDTGSLGEQGARELAILSALKGERVAPMDHGELLAVRGPSAPRQGEKSFGTLAFKDGDRFVSRRVENGIIYGANNEKLGTVKDNGDVTIGGESFNILTDAKRAAAFTGKGTDGLYLDLTAGQSLSGGSGEGVKNGGFTGYIENGRERMLTLGGHIFNGKQLLGQVSTDGKMSFNRELAQAEKDGTPISQVLMGSTFVGREDGFDRRVNFTRTSGGSAFLPSLPGLGAQGEVELRLGMVIDRRTNRQVANFEAPTLSDKDGEFSGGALVIGNKRLLLNEVQGFVFKAKVDGEDKVMQGVVAGKAERQADGSLRPGSSMVINLDNYAELSASNFKEKTKDYKSSEEHKERSELLDQYKWTSGVGYVYSEYRKNEDYSAQAKETAFGLAARQFHSDMSTINKLLTGEQVDPSQLQKLKVNHELYINSSLSPLKRLEREIDKPGHELEQVSADAQRSGKILRPVPGKPGEVEEYELVGKLFYKKGSEHPVGSVDFATGKIVWPGEEGVNSLGSPALRGTVFGCNYVDKDGKARSLNWVNDGQGLLSTDTLRKQVAQECAYAKLLSKDNKDENLLSADKRTGELAQRYNKLLNAIDTGGVKDDFLPESGFTSLELLRRGPRDIVRAEHNKEGRNYKGTTIAVPPMASVEEVQRTSGAMRLGNAHYLADHGKLYHAQARKKENGEIEWVRAEGEAGRSPCGVLRPGYKAEIFGQKEIIDLQSERTFLFKMQVEGVPGERLIVGLGAPRRDTAGNLVGGGLIDVQEVSRRNKEAITNINLSAKQYKDDETWLGIGAFADWAMGGREEQLDGVADSASFGDKLVQKQMNQLFDEGVDGNRLTSADALRNIDSIQRRMRELNISAVDAGELSAQGRSNQAGAREGLAMVATTALSGGASLLVNAGRLTLAQGALATFVGGGLSSAAIRQTKGGDWRQFAQNAGAGGLETTLMLATGGLGKVSESFSTLGKSSQVVEALADARYLPKLQALAQEGKLAGNLAKLGELQAAGQLSKVGTRALAELAENPQALKLAELMQKGHREAEAVKAACELLGNKRSAELIGKIAIAGPESFSAIGKVGAACNATVQTVGFNVIGSGRHGAEIDLDPKRFLTNNAEGTAWTLAGDFLGNLTHVNIGPKFLDIDNLKRPLSGKEKFFDGLVSSYAENVINNSTNSALMALTEVRKVERENIARELGIDLAKVDDQMYEEHKNEARMRTFIFDRALEGAATTVFTHPITHSLTNRLGSRLESQASERQRLEARAEEIQFIEDKINRQISDNFADNFINKQARIDQELDTTKGASSSGQAGRPQASETKDTAPPLAASDRHSEAADSRSQGLEKSVAGKEPWPLRSNAESAKDSNSTITTGARGAANSSLSQGTVHTKHEGGVEKFVNDNGSVLILKNGQAALIKDAKGNEASVYRDEADKPYKIVLSDDAALLREDDGWHLALPDGTSERVAQKIEVDNDGTIHQIDDHGVIVSNTLSGERHVYVPGDHPVGQRLDVQHERNRFEQNLLSVTDSLVSARIREDMLDIEFRLKGQAGGDEKYTRVLYELNRLLEAPGLVPLERRLRWAEELTSLAARPELLSQGSNPTCAMAAAEQREYFLHPETFFQMMRRLNDTGLVVLSNGRVLDFRKDGALKIEPDGDALAHREPGVVWADGRRLEVSQIAQTVMMDIIRGDAPEPRKNYFAGDIEPMISKLTGRDEKFVIQWPKDAVDFVRQLAEIKERGQLYAIVQMDSAHLGARGLTRDGGHARIVKDIRTLPADLYTADGLPAKEILVDGKKTLVPDAEKIEVIFGNTWDKGDSDQVLTADKAHLTTLQSTSVEHLEILAGRLRAGGADPYERAELLTWRTGFLSAVLDKKIVGADSSTAEAALTKVVDGSLTTKELRAEYDKVESEFVDGICRQRKLLSGDKAEQLLRLQLHDMLAGNCIKKDDLIDMGINYRDRHYLDALSRVKRRLSNMALLEERIADGRIDLSDAPAGAEQSPLVVSGTAADSLGWALGAMRDANEAKTQPHPDRVLQKLSENFALSKDDLRQLNARLEDFKAQNPDFVARESELDAETRIIDALKENVSTTFDKTTFDAVNGIASQAGLEWKLDNLRQKGELHNYEATVLNLAGFKQANDKFSHAVGDLVLKAASHYLRDCGLANITPIKLAGDKFALIAPRGSADTVHALLQSIEITPASDHVFIKALSAKGDKFERRIPPFADPKAKDGQGDSSDLSPASKDAAGGVLIKVASTGANAMRTISLVGEKGERSTLEILNDIHGNGPQKSPLVKVDNVTALSLKEGHEARKLANLGRQDLLASNTISHTIVDSLGKAGYRSGAGEFEPGRLRDLSQETEALKQMLSKHFSKEELVTLASVLEQEGHKLRAAYLLDRGTGIMAKNAYEELLKQRVESGEADGLIVCDVKGFAGVNGVTRYNRSLGMNRAVGDAAIAATVDALRDAVRMCGLPKHLADKVVLARLGGDELGLVLPSELTVAQRKELLGEVDSIRLAIKVNQGVVDVRRFNPGEALKPGEIDIGVAAGLADLKFARAEQELRIKLDRLKSEGKIDEAKAILEVERDKHSLTHARFNEIEKALDKPDTSLVMELHSILQGQGDAASEHVKQAQKQFRVLEERDFAVAKEMMDALLGVEDAATRLGNAQRILQAAKIHGHSKNSLSELLRDGRNNEMTVEQVAFVLGERLSFSRANPQYAGQEIKIARMHVEHSPVDSKPLTIEKTTLKGRVVKDGEVVSQFLLPTSVVIRDFVKSNKTLYDQAVAIYKEDGTLIGGQAYRSQNEASNATYRARKAWDGYDDDRIAVAEREMLEAKRKLAEADQLTYQIEQLKKAEESKVGATVNPPKERNGELSIQEAREALTVNFAELSEKGTAALLKVHLLLNKHPHFTEENMRLFSEYLDGAITDKIMSEYDGRFSPALAGRFAKHLEDAINEYGRRSQPNEANKSNEAYEPLQVSVLAMPDEFFKPGELMAYRPGTGQILVRHSDLANPGLLENYALFHEYVHADQDRARFRLAALTCLRRDGSVDASSMVEEYCRQSGQMRIDPLERGFAVRELGLAKDWLDKRKGLSAEELAQDPEFIRASRLMESSKNPQPITTEHLKAQAEAIIKLNPFSQSPSRFLQEVMASDELQRLYFRSPLFSEAISKRDAELLQRVREFGSIEDVLFDVDNKAGLNARARVRLQFKYLAEQLEQSDGVEQFDSRMRSRFEKMMVENLIESVQHKKRVDFRNYVHDHRELEANYAGHVFAKVNGLGSTRLAKATPAVRHLDDMIREVRSVFPVETKSSRNLLAARRSHDDGHDQNDNRSASKDSDAIDMSELSDLFASFAKGQDESETMFDDDHFKTDIMMDVGVPGRAVDWSELSRTVSDLDDPDERTKMAEVLNSIQNNSTVETIEQAKLLHAYLEAQRLHRLKNMGI
jgi:GGDEF domain-containing protein